MSAGWGVRRIDRAGIITTVVGDGSEAPASGDGGPAREARIGGTATPSLAFGPDGSLYLSSGNRVRRVGPDGIITTVMGNGS